MRAKLQRYLEVQGFHEEFWIIFFVIYFIFRLIENQFLWLFYIEEVELIFFTRKRVPKFVSYVNVV